MNAFEVLASLVLLRIVLPVGLLLLIGEAARNVGRRPSYHG